MVKPHKLRDFAPETDAFLREVVAGLGQPQKQIPSKYFYDEEGSRLFDQITQLEEYYPTVTETKIMNDNIDEIVECIGHGSMLIEYGSGSSEKTKILLDHLDDLAVYIPVDISKDHLTQSAARIARRYPNLEVIPVAADYSAASSFTLPASRAVSHKVVYYPGSTIGNFHPHEAADFLERMRHVAGPGGGILLGVDLEKDPAILHAAYNDKQEVTARFNLNVLQRLNNELGANFDLEQWRHRAIYNGDARRVEMHLVSLSAQTVTIGHATFQFETGETIWTESSYKYSVARFEKLAREAGLEVSCVWTDARDFFSVQYLAAADD